MKETISPVSASKNINQRALESNDSLTDSSKQQYNAQSVN
jgi:hypothetical protein